MRKELIFLIISDILIVGSFGLFAPILAIFIKEGVSGGSIAAAAIASSIFWLVKSIVQIPLSIYIDSKKGRLSFLILGTLLIILVPIIYAFSPNVNFIYIAQGIYGLGAAMATPTWLSLFSMYLDRKHRGLEWSIWSTSIGIALAFAAFLGGKLVDPLGFNLEFKSLFFIVSGISFLGILVLFLISRKSLEEVKKVESYLIPKMLHKR